MNVKLEYLYRDAGNNKKWGDVIFKNLENINIKLLNTMIRNVIIQNEFFIANKSGLPIISFQDTDRELDHDWYEYSTVENTDEQENDIYSRDILEFIEMLKQAL